MKTFIANFLLYVYNNYIVEDWGIFKPFGKIVIYPFWFIKSIIMWVLSPLFVIEYLVVSSNFYKELQKEISKFELIF